jgi:apolipoprotein N-acyltransferase
MIKIYTAILSLILVALGQPSFCWWCGIIASLIGYAIFWQSIVDKRAGWQKFWLGCGWFASIQLIQLSWMISHPYAYIYAVYLLLALALGMQFGLLCLLIDRKKLTRIRNLFAIAGIWVFMEWSRLFFLSGYPWNPVGLALASSFFPLQTASLWGTYGLSFWVIWVNLLALKVWLEFLPTKRLALACLWIAVAAFPFIYGMGQVLYYNLQEFPKNELSTVLVQTAFPAEETIAFPTKEHAVAFVVEEWKSILNLLKQHQDKKIDVLVIPEYAVPFGTYYPMFPFTTVKKAFHDILGSKSVEHLPELDSHLAMNLDTKEGRQWMVNNAFWIQAIANIFQADVIVGLEDREIAPQGETVHYSSAFHFCPSGDLTERYEKRVLLPMGEYIPFDFCRKLAASYGISGSFTCGTEAKAFSCRVAKIGVSICYEELFGNMMRENRLKGADVLANLSNDGWYPHSRLTSQHLEHARLRAVEMGIPLIRSCNTGITAAIDSLGKTIACIGNENEDPDDISDALFVKVPLKTYKTLYTYTGDSLILILSACFISWAACTGFFRRP